MNLTYNETEDENDDSDEDDDDNESYSGIEPADPEEVPAKKIKTVEYLFHHYKAESEELF